MWVFTTLGFFSVVQKKGTLLLTVRARVAKDLDKLRNRVLQELTPTILTPQADYPARATCTHDPWALAIARLALMINYDTFKHEVDLDRQMPYLEIWQAARGLEPEVKKYRQYLAGRTDVSPNPSRTSGNS